MVGRLLGVGVGPGVLQDLPKTACGQLEGVLIGTAVALGIVALGFAAPGSRGPHADAATTTTARPAERRPTERLDAFIAQTCRKGACLASRGITAETPATSSSLRRWSATVPWLAWSGFA
jgi:hypothetical protein